MKIHSYICIISNICTNIQGMIKQASNRRGRTQTSHQRIWDLVSFMATLFKFHPSLIPCQPVFVFKPSGSRSRLAILIYLMSVNFRCLLVQLQHVNCQIHFCVRTMKIGIMQKKIMLRGGSQVGKQKIYNFSVVTFKLLQLWIYFLFFIFFVVGKINSLSPE